MLKTFGIGGAERSVLELAPYLPDVEFLPVAVSAAPLDAEPALREAGFEPRTLGAGNSFDFAWVRRLRRLIQKERPDVVHLHNPVAAAGGRIAARGLNVPIVTTEHNVWETYHLASRFANAATFVRNDAVIAVSQAVGRSILASRTGRRHAELIRVIRNGIDTDVVRREGLEPPATEIPPGSYGTVTHLRHRKGVDVLIEAAAALRKAFPGRRCLVGGIGPLERRLRRQSHTSGDAVEFLGLRTDARRILHALDVVVIPSRHEGLPLVLLEAMALGRPIVATRVDGIAEVLEDGVTGLLVPAEDPAALALALARLFREPELGGRLGSAARDAVERRFHARETAAAIGRVYRDVM